MPNPVDTPEKYVRVHRALDAIVKRAIATPRPRVQITSEAYESLKSSGRSSLKANNAEARIALALGLHKIIDGLIPWQKDIFWVTLVRREHAVPLSKSSNFNVDLVRRWIQEVMEGWNYIGMIEAALYSNYREGYGDDRYWTSWHGHLLCWGRSKAELAHLRNRINDWTRSFIHGLQAMHFYKPAISQLPSKMLYAAKISMSDHRLFKRYQPIEAAGDSGTNFTWVQKKRRLRPGDAVRTYNAMGSRTLDDLIVSGGSGCAHVKHIMQQMRNSAIAPAA